MYTPFYKRLAADGEPRDPVDAPNTLRAAPAKVSSEKLESFDLLPKKPDWSGGLADRWVPGERGAMDRLETFLDERLEGYSEKRDVPGVEGTSGLSPHLAHGEITPFQIMAALRRRSSGDAEKFRKEACMARILLSPAVSPPRHRP